LDKIKIGLKNSICISENFKNFYSEKLDIMVELLSDHIVAGLEAKVFGETLDKKKYPINWWEAFKERWFLTFFKKYFLVKYKVINYTCLYPKISLLDKEQYTIYKCNFTYDRGWGDDTDN
jgi:hypothetical protein